MMRHEGNVILLGYMATGKTEVSKRLAEKLDRRYVSVDDEIERREGRKISDIFAADGETYFRAREKAVLRELCGGARQVIDTGGGVVLDEENMSVMLSSGACICLWAGVDEILRRTSGSGHRPLLDVSDPEERIKAMLDERRPYYEKAPYHVDTSGRSPEDVVDQITELISAEEER